MSKKSDDEAHLPNLQMSSGTGDVERNAKLSPSVESRVPTTSKFVYLTVYFLCNVSLTIWNKAVLGKFAYPWLLTTLHAGSASIGCYILLLRGTFSLTKLSRQENVVLALFSFLFTINIAISNVSLSMVSMPFHQILRSTTPIFTILIYRLRFNRSYSTRTYLSLVPIVAGVGLATYGDYYFTLTGFWLTLLGVVLAAVKTVVSNRIMTGPLALSPLEILFRMSPLAFIQGLLYSSLSGEISSLNLPLSPSTFLSLLSPSATSLSVSLSALLPSRNQALALAGNGILAFILNIASFSANKNTGALTMTVCGNLKQCLTILLGILVFGLKVGWLNGLGMIVTLLGAGCYSVIELRGRRK